MSVPLVELGDICTTTQGVQITKANTSDELYDGGYRYLYIADFISDKKLSFVDDKFDTKKVTEHDLVMANTGSPGRVFKGKKGILSNNLFRITFNEEIVNRDYLYLILSSSLFQGHLQQQMKGGIQKHLGHKTISRQSVPLPSLDDQVKIAEILDVADSLRKKDQQLVVLYDRLSQSLFLDMFGDPFVNPNNWPQVTLEQVIEEGPQNGLYKPSSAYGSGTPIVRIDAFYNDIVAIKKLKRLRAEKAEIERFELFEGDFVINRVNSPSHLGKCGLMPKIDERVVFESNMMRIKFDKTKVNNAFLLPMLSSQHLKNQILNSSKDAVNQSSINQKDVNSYSIPLPPITLQNKFADRVNEIEKQKALAEQSLKKSDDLFNSLLQRAFKGELTAS